jgi:hypothetical protein
MFDPTYRLLDLAEKLELPVVLFTDVLCGIRFKEWDKSSFYEPMSGNYRMLPESHHDVQLHLHPIG